MREQYTIRIYDSNLKSKLEKLFKDCKDIYATKNPFLVDCLVRGIEMIEKDLSSTKKASSIQDLYEDLHLTIEKLNNLIKMSEKNAKENLANLTVNQKLLSCNYNMLLGLTDNAPKKSELVEAGMYDDLPFRLGEMLEQLLNVCVKKK